MTQRKMNILAICGSTRKQSSNLSILNYIKEMHSDLIDLEIYTSIADLPHFNPDLTHENVPQIVTTWQNKIKEADAIIICTPEYVFSIPGSLKNAIEWTVSTTVFSNKPTAIIVASGAGEKAFESLIMIMKTLEAKVENNTTLLISGARSIIDAQGKINNEKIKGKIDGVVGNLVMSYEL